MLDSNVIIELDKPLDPARITTFSQGPQKGVRYLEGEDVIRTANRIFGYGGWGYRLIGQPVCVEDGEQGSNNTPYQVWTAHVELTVEGCQPIADLGTNTRQGKGAAALEMAIKGAVTDGIKRCLKTFGDQFGLVLYDKDVSLRDLQEAHGDLPPVHPPTAPKADAPEWWVAFRASCEENNVTAYALEQVLKVGPSLKTVEAWLAAEPGRHWSNLVSEAQRKQKELMGVG